MLSPNPVPESVRCDCARAGRFPPSPHLKGAQPPQEAAHPAFREWNSRPDAVVRADRSFHLSNMQKHPPNADCRKATQEASALAGASLGILSAPGVAGPATWRMLNPIQLMRQRSRRSRKTSGAAWCGSAQAASATSLPTLRD